SSHRSVMPASLACPSSAATSSAPIPAPRLAGSTASERSNPVRSKLSRPMTPGDARWDGGGIDRDQEAVQLPGFQVVHRQARVGQEALDGRPVLRPRRPYG